MENSNANSRQVGGQHYQSEVQHWDYVAASGLDYFQGQITKYVYRWRKKNGIEDLKKAMHFLEKYLEVRMSYPRRSFCDCSSCKENLDTFISANRVPLDEAYIIRSVDMGHPENLLSAKLKLQCLIADTEASEPSAGYVNQDRDAGVVDHG